MAVSGEYLDHLRDLFADFGAVEPRRLFGGVGLFRDGVMFALVMGDTLYLRVDERSLPEFEAAGMAPFSYATRGGRREVGSYYEAPAELFDDPGELAAWSRRSLDAALAADARKPRHKRRRS